MGLFDNLIKAVKDSGIDKGLAEVGKELEKTVNDASATLNGGNTRSSKSVPEKYLGFPQFDGVISDVTVKDIDKYDRCTIDYNESTYDKIEEYRQKVVSAGYAKATNVRYEKGNEYIIIDPDDTYMHIVFHVKH